MNDYRTENKLVIQPIDGISPHCSALQKYDFYLKQEAFETQIDYKSAKCSVALG